jgi:hypothetical protein
MVARVRGARPGRHARGGGQGGARGRRPGRRAGARPRGHEARPGRRAGAAAREARGVGERRKKRKGRERGGELTTGIQIRRSVSPKPRAPRERERWERGTLR